MSNKLTSIESRLITENTQLWKKPDSLSTKAKELLEILNLGQLRMIGPCALQSGEQMEIIVSQVFAALGKDVVIRDPFEKPRTRPVNDDGQQLFDGVGIEKGREILLGLRHSHPNVKITAEVMSANSLRQMHDLLNLAWIGARTTVPPTLANIGQVAKLPEIQIPLMVKNSLSGDIQQHVGMMEHIINGSRPQVPIIACIRGREPHTVDEKSRWRNVPNPELLDQLKIAFPDLPVIVDVSHMLPKERLNVANVMELINQANDRGADGWMVEVFAEDHPSLTDPGVSVTELMDALIKIS